MTRISTIRRNSLNFDEEKKRYESICELSGYTPDQCLSMTSGEEKCNLFRISEEIVLKMDPNNNHIYAIVDEVD